MSETRSVHQDELRVGTGFSRVAKYLIAHFEARDTLTDGRYAACDVAARRPWELKREHLAQETLGAPRIDSVHAGVMVFDKYLSARWVRNGNFVYVERCSIVIDT
jgi:hypothetical protein